MKQQTKLERAVLILALFGLSIALLYFGKPFLVPFALGGLLAMLLTKLCEHLERFKMPRGVAALIALLGFVLIVAGVLTLLGWQLAGFSENMDELQHRAAEVVAQFRAWLQDSVGIDQQQQQKMVEQPASSAGATGSVLMDFASGTMSIAVDTILVLVYTFLFITFRRQLKNFVLLLVPVDKRNETTKVLHESASVAQHYLGGLSKMIVALWIMYGLGFSVLGVENAIFFAVFCGLMEIIPFVGNLIGTSFTVLAVAVQGGDSRMILGVIGVYLFVQFIQTYLLEPLVVGNEVRINPLFTIVGLVLGELIWGVGGMVLAIPLLGILLIVFDHVPSLKPYAYLIGSYKEKKKK
ncbi:AI-2E family transporter [Sphingobacterium sp. lm-10]|uniref:AI-2E family transporter n=1 Tax=Sphingobacterium sp. lm-10 TaxID=2944904 RepID=UPI002020014E|nr:AI-2E family transporter [Sphingobacterium sp. lm-10]MCL7988937.1 AI-2E family transporter [Sphingobacterium sp. lm-10]